MISHSQSQVDQSSKVLLSLPSWKDILKNPFLALIPPWHRLGFPKCQAGEGGVSVRAGTAAPGCAEHHGHTRSRKWLSRGRLVPFRVPNSHLCWEMMLLQLFSIPKCKVNSDGPRMMSVSLSFSWGDVTLQLSSFVSFFCYGGCQESEIPPQTNPGLPQQLHHRKLHTQTLLQWGQGTRAGLWGEGKDKGGGCQFSQSRADPTFVTFLAKRSCDNHLFCGFANGDLPIHQR